MKKEIPILFSTPMVQAILAGRKTMTRRIIKSKHESGMFRICRRVTDGQIINIESLDWDERNCEKDILCPYGKPGDLLWVRESMYQVWEEGVFYSADNTPWDCPADFAYRSGNCAIPSIHVPKAAARIWLEVTDVRVERLQEISEEDAIAEGAEIIKGAKWKPIGSPDNEWRDYTYKDGFMAVWQHINGPDSWEANPWVWVVSFRVVSTTGKP